MPIVASACWCTLFQQCCLDLEPFSCRTRANGTTQVHASHIQKKNNRSIYTQGFGRGLASVKASRSNRLIRQAVPLV